MRNFKLLLATTAILSTGAFVANADPADTVSMNVHARVVSASGGAVMQHIDFGTLIKPAAGSTYAAKASMDPETGVVTYLSNEEQTIRTFEEARKPGILTFTYDGSEDVIGNATVPEYLELTHSLGEFCGARFYPAIQKINTIADGNDVVQTYHIGGYIAGLSSLSTGDYNATFTVTLLLEEE